MAFAGTDKFGKIYITLYIYIYIYIYRPIYISMYVCMYVCMYTGLGAYSLCIGLRACVVCVSAS